MKKLLFTMTLLLLSSNLFAENFDLNMGQSSVGFNIIKFKIGAPVEGHFNNFSGTFDYDSKTNTISKIEIKIKTASIDTGNKKRDSHLQTDDFFNATKFPHLTFSSTVKTKVKNNFKINGKLKIRGVEKDVILSVTTVEQSGKNLVFTATTQINRLDFGVSWNKGLEKSSWKKVLGILGTMVLDDNVNINLKVVGELSR